MGLLEKYRVEGAAHGRQELRGSAANAASIPLQRQTVLRVEKVAHCVRHWSLELGLWLPERGERQDSRWGLWEGFVTRECSSCRVARG